MADDRYAELRCKTNFSFLEGTSHPDELIARAAELGYAALAVTDRNTLAGVVRAHVAAKSAGLKLLIGAEVTPADAPPVLLYASDLAAYGRLSRLITRGRRNAPKGECRLSFADVAEHTPGLLAAVVPPDADEMSYLARYREAFGDRCYLAVSLCHGPDDQAELERLDRLARRARLHPVACNDVHYHVPERRPLHDVLTAVRHGVTVAELGALRFANGERHLKSPAEMMALFARCPRALAHGLELAGRCTFRLDELRYEYPEEVCPAGLSPREHLADLTWKGARERYPAGVPEKVAALLQRELELIAELRYETYFLTVWDLIRFARSRAILCQGRGSAANSAVCYCLGITAVDPDRSDLLFDRFVSRERAEAPDIDVDFEHERREEVLQYVYAKYGRDRAGITAEVICYRPRSAVRDVGKALGLSLDRVDRIAKALDHHDREPDLATVLREAGLEEPPSPPSSPGQRSGPGRGEAELRERRSQAALGNEKEDSPPFPLREGGPGGLGSQLVTLTSELIGFPRHLSQHVGGFVITRGPLSELVPVENAAMPERTVIEWDKDDLDDLGILKVDCLGLGMLTAIRKCFALVEAHHGRSLTLADVPAEDPAVYDMIGRADTVGVFQIESRAQMSMLPRLRPRCFYDLVIEVAIVRPGPIQGGMVHPYLRRRAGLEPVTYPSPEVAQVLSKTLGVPLFQEQVMRLAMVAAGFTPGEADQLRRAMGAWRRPGLIENFRTRLRTGMVARGLPEEYAEQIYRQIRGFGEYGFPEAHAASFALLAYISAWLRCHYPAAFAVAILNSQPMGFYAPAQIVRDARAHGVEVRAVDVNTSDWDCTLEPDGGGAPVLRLGLRLIKGLPRLAVDSLVEGRAEVPYRSVSDCACRGRIGRGVLARLAAADAFGSLGLSRRTATWHALAAGDELPLFAGLDADDGTPALPAAPLDDEVVADYDSTGLSLKAHPIGLLRPELEALEVIPSSVLTGRPDRSIVRVAGLVLVRQAPPTAKGAVFITLEDEDGPINLVVWPNVWKRYGRFVRAAVALLVQGRLERASDVVHVAALRMEDLSEALGGITAQSRDFR